jgi:hypothetical protein
MSELPLQTPFPFHMLRTYMPLDDHGDNYRSVEWMTRMTSLSEGQSRIELEMPGWGRRHLKYDSALYYLPQENTMTEATETKLTYAEQKLAKKKKELEALENQVIREKILNSNKPMVSVGDKPSPKAEAITNLIQKGGFGCQSKAVAELVSLIIGEQIVVNDKSKWPTGKVVVVLKNRNTTYPLNTPCITEKLGGWSHVIETTKVGRVDGDSSIFTTNELADHWRYATQDEVKEFVKNLDSASLKFIAEHILLR